MRHTCSWPTGDPLLITYIVYAHMQATGMVNDHIKSCFRYKELVKKYGS